VSPQPEYPEEARKAKKQGTVVLSVVIGSDGTVGDVSVTRSLGSGFDEKAVEAVKKWEFEPASKDGRPVAVRVDIQLDFRLR
jgi:TonB family protein